MEKKRSVGITLFGLIFIIRGITDFWTFKKGLPHLSVGLFGFLGTFFWRIISPLARFIGGIFILRLHEWARKLILIVYAAAFLVIVANSISYLYQGLTPIGIEKIITEEVQQEIIQESMEKYKSESEETIKQRTQSAIKMAPYVFYLLFCIWATWNLCVIYFFTRPRVKEQFK